MRPVSGAEGVVDKVVDAAAEGLGVLRLVLLLGLVEAHVLQQEDLEKFAASVF